MKLTTVGTGTAAPHASRVCAGHLVQAGDVHLLMDCGSGVVHRMAELGVAWPAITHVALTHFHADHIADLAMLVFAWKWGQLPPRSAPATIIGPVGLTSLLERIAAAFGAWLLDPGFPLVVHEMTPEESMDLGSDVTLSCLAVPHTTESVAYSIVQGAHRLVYTGDTGHSEALGQWAAHATVLLAECSLPDAMAIPEHLTPRLAGTLAAIARPALLVLTHLYPPVESEDVAAQVAEHFAGPVVIATDGWSIEL